MSRPIKHLVITVHGIRTFGGWQERLENLLHAQGSDRELTIINYKFGYFSILAFIFPLLRLLVVRRFRLFFVDLVKSQPWDRIDLVGHSFGTHVIAWALYGINSAARPAVHTIVLSGSVLKSGFPWQVLIGKSVKRVVNDCGTNDSILILNQIFVLGTGMAGRLGFNGGMGESFRNRFFDCGHSGFFLTAGIPDDNFMQRYWIPLLLSDTKPELVDMRRADALGGVKLWLLNNAEPIKIFVYLAPLVALLLYFNFLRTTSQTQFQRADRNFNITHKLLSDYLETVSETVKHYAQVEVLDALLSKTTDLLKTVPSGDDQRIRLERSRANIILAEIKWDRGRIDEMNDLAKEAMPVMESLSRDHNVTEEQRLEAKHLLARSTALSGLYYSASAVEPDPNKASERNQEAIDLLEDLERRFENTRAIGTEWRWLRSLARLRQDRGDMLLKRGELDKATKFYEKSKATWETLSQVRPDDLETKFSRAWANNKLGDIQRDIGDNEKAFGYFREAAELIEKCVKDRPANLHWRDHLAITKNNVGLTQRRLKRYDEAKKAFLGAKKDIDEALDQDRGHSHRRSILAWTLGNLGMTRVQHALMENDPSKLSDAKHELAQAHEVNRELAKLGVARWHFSARISQANVFALNGTMNIFERFCVKAARDFQDAAKTNPKSTGDEGDDEMVLRTVQFKEQAGLLFRQAGRWVEAQPELKEALNLAETYSPKFAAQKSQLATAGQRLQVAIAGGPMTGPTDCKD
jgi:tetratricopeptide (TPR) repeat protein